MNKFRKKLEFFLYDIFACPVGHMGVTKPYPDLLFMLVPNMDSDLNNLENSNRKFKISIFMIF